MTDLQKVGGDHMNKPLHASLPATKDLAKNCKHAGWAITGKVTQDTLMVGRGSLEDRGEDKVEA